MNKRLVNRNEERMGIKQRLRLFILEAVAHRGKASGRADKKSPSAARTEGDEQPVGRPMLARNLIR